MAIIECEVPDGHSPSEFEPFPGSNRALSLGCTCPDKQPWPKLHFDSDCPIHELERVPN